MGEYNKLEEIDKTKVEAVRGSTDYTVVYMIDGETFYVKEDYEKTANYLGFN